MTTDLEALSAAIPQMGGRTIGPWLRQWAAESRGAIVEVGCWLGAGTAQLALGARVSGQPIHTYDQWQARASEVAKAQVHGARLRPGQNTLPLVSDTLAPFGVLIVFHQGPVQSATWIGDPIGLFVLDTAKQEKSFAYVRSVFWPCLVPGAVVVLMDYHYYEQKGPTYRAQRDVMEGHTDRFELIGDHLGGTSAAAFRDRRGGEVA